MSKLLVDFINICLLDGEISEKERQGIFNKAKELGISKEECEITIDSLAKQYQSEATEKIKPKAESRKFSRKTAIYKSKATFDKKKTLQEEISKEQLLASQLIDSTKENGKSFISTSEKIIDQKKEIESLIEIKSNLRQDYLKILMKIRLGVERELESKLASPSEIDKLIYKANFENIKKHFFNSVWDYGELSASRKLKFYLFRFLYFLVFVYWFYDLDFSDDESSGLFSDEPWFGLSGWLVFGVAILMVFVSEYYKTKMGSNLMDFNESDVASALDKIVTKQVLDELSVLNNMNKELNSLSSNLKFKTSVDFYVEEKFFNTNVDKLHLINKTNK